MLMSVSEAVNSDSTDSNYKNEVMPAILSSNSKSSMNSKSTSMSATALETSAMSPGAGPLWWS